MPATYVHTMENYPIALLTEYPGRAKLHDDQALDDSRDQLGQYRSIVGRQCPPGDTVQILCGHGVMETFRRGEQTTVRVEVIDCTDAEARAIVLADNEIGRRAGYDEPALLALLDAANRETGLTATGFDETAYKELVDRVRPRVAPDDVDDIPEPPADPLTKLGSVWALGRHRLLCGSSLEAGTVRRALQEHWPAVVHADAPYGINIVKPDGTLGDATGYRPVIGDENTGTAASAFTLLHNDLFTDALHIWWGANHYAYDAVLPNASCWLVWNKENGGTAFADAELAWTNHPGAARLTTHRWMGAARASETGPRHHPNQKPVEVIRWALNTTWLGSDLQPGVVLDPFAGSGPTLLASELMNETCVAIELDPAYCDVIATRWANLTGQTPQLDGEDIGLNKLARLR